MAKSIFKNIDLGYRNFCHHCKWQETNMCPRSQKFIGTYCGDRDHLRMSPNTICYKFSITTQEREKRESLILEKMLINLPRDHE